MTWAEAEAVMKSVTYKPFCRVFLTPSMNMERHALYVQFQKVPDATNPRRTTGVMMVDSILLSETRPEELRRRIHELICRLEMHEVDEFLRFDGKHYREPHPEKQ